MHAPTCDREVAQLLPPDLQARKDALRATLAADLADAERLRVDLGAKLYQARMDETDPTYRDALKLYVVAEQRLTFRFEELARLGAAELEVLKEKMRER